MALKPLVKYRKGVLLPFLLVVKCFCNLMYRLPVPAPPPFELLKDVALDGLTISIVAYAMALSMALIFAQKLNYKVDANQELLAQVIAAAKPQFLQ